MITREFQVGEQRTSLLVRLYRPGGTPYVLDAEETVAFRMVLVSDGSVKVDDAACTIVSVGSSTTNTPAEVRYDWAAEDVDTAGEFAGWMIPSLDGAPSYFPVQEYDNPEFRIIFRSAGA